MDRALKERIIGAAVLVVFVVLVVPVFLDGPPDDDAVLTERVPLPGQDEQPVKVIVLDRDRSEPVPSTVAQLPEAEPEVESQPEIEAPAPVRPDPEPRVSEPEPVSDNAAEESKAEEATRPPPVISRSTNSATGMWAVQLGSFSSEENANRLAADLRQKGFAAFLSKTTGDDGVLHRVRIGPQKDRPAAEAMAGRLEEAGHKGQVVPHP